MAISNDEKSLEHITSFATPANPKSFIKQVQTYLKDFSNITLTVGGVRGVLSEDKTALEHDVMLNDWIDFPLQSELKKVTGSDVRLENDAVLAGLGEAIFGSGKDVEVIVWSAG